MILLFYHVLPLSYARTSNCIGPKGPGPCLPGNDYCGEPFQNAPKFHLMDQHGCGENDPNGPVFDPVHGVVHHFYQIHLAASPGRGPDYGHFVSKDFVNWADVRTAIWNGYDSSFDPPKVTKYDNEAIFTGSAQIVNGAGPGGGPGVVNIYPGLCNKKDWPACGTGTLLAMAIPADYSDELLINWTKPDFNPIMENTQRDPASPWKEPSGEWRLRTYDSSVYGSASDADFLAGKWYKIGVSHDFRTCECPSFYPLPEATPGFENEYDAALKTGALPTHVHKTSCGGDWWQMGTYTPGAPKVLGTFVATPGYEDLFAQRRIDQGNFYASKDNIYPTKTGTSRRINWGWATVPPASTQTLPRHITFNPSARVLEQRPIDELEELRGNPVFSKTDIRVDNASPLDLHISNGVAKQSEIIVAFPIPAQESTFGVTVGPNGAPTPKGTPVNTFMKGTDLSGNDYSITHHPPNTDPHTCEAMCNNDTKCDAWTYVIRGNPEGSGDCCLKSGSIPCPSPNGECTSGAKVNTTLSHCGGGGGGEPVTSCTVHYTPNTNISAPYHEVSVSCGKLIDTLRILPNEKTIELRIFADWTFLE
eukprot:UC4_evm1s708